MSLRGISRTADDEAIFFAWIIKIASPAKLGGLAMTKWVSQ